MEINLNEFFSGDFLDIYRTSSGYFRLECPWGILNIPSEDEMMDFLSDVQTLIEEEIINE